MQQEQKLKQVIEQIQQTMVGVLGSALDTEQYAGTQIMCTFSVIELDMDLLQAMINCVSVALLSSAFKCRCLPTAISMLVQKPIDGQQSAPVIDPNLR